MFVTLAYIACIVSRIVYMLNGDELYMLMSNKVMLCYIMCLCCSSNGVKNKLLHKKQCRTLLTARALIGEKPCINKVIHALLMHGYATFNMIVPGPQISYRYEMCIARP